MINRLCKRLNQNIEVRQSLSSLRQEIKDSSKRELLLSWIHDGDLDLSVFLENEDAKTRKNAALLIGDLALSSESDAVFHAYQTEDTRKRGLFNCFKIFKCGSLCGCFPKTL